MFYPTFNEETLAKVGDIYQILHGQILLVVAEKGDPKGDDCPECCLRNLCEDGVSIPRCMMLDLSEGLRIFHALQKFDLILDEVKGVGIVLDELSSVITLALSEDNALYSNLKEDRRFVVEWEISREVEPFKDESSWKVVKYEELDPDSPERAAADLLYSEYCPERMDWGNFEKHQVVSDLSVQEVLDNIKSE